MKEILLGSAAAGIIALMLGASGGGSINFGGGSGSSSSLPSYVLTNNYVGPAIFTTGIIITNPFVGGGTTLLRSTNGALVSDSTIFAAFTGNGSGITNLNASSLASGTVSDLVLTNQTHTNVTLVNAIGTNITLVSPTLIGGMVSNTIFFPTTNTAGQPFTVTMIVSNVPSSTDRTLIQMNTTEVLGWSGAAGLTRVQSLQVANALRIGGASTFLTQPTANQLKVSGNPDGSGACSVLVNGSVKGDQGFYSTNGIITVATVTAGLTNGMAWQGMMSNAVQVAWMSNNVVMWKIIAP